LDFEHELKEIKIHIMQVNKRILKNRTTGHRIGFRMKQNTCLSNFILFIVKEFAPTNTPDPCPVHGQPVKKFDWRKEGVVGAETYSL